MSELEYDQIIPFIWLAQYRQCLAVLDADKRWASLTQPYRINDCAVLQHVLIYSLHFVGCHCLCTVQDCTAMCNGCLIWVARSLMMMGGNINVNVP